MPAPARYEIDVAACRPSAAARPVQDIHVTVLARSIEEVGLINPITVRATDDGFEVIAGMHRLRAFQHLGRDTIPAIVRHDDDLRAELALIDENLIRAELSPAERAIAIGRRKAIYEALHPRTVHGGDRKSSRQNGDLIADDADRFTKATAESIGQSERTVQRDAQRVSDIGAEELSKIVGTSLDKGDEIDALTKLVPEKRQQVIDRAAAGDKVSAKVEAKKERRDGRERDLAGKQRALPEKRYGLIYVDIPRHFNVRSDAGLDRSPENHYPTMTFEETLALPVPQLAADDCILVFWSTAASLLDDIEIMAEWGFVSLRPRDDLGRLSRPNGVALPPAGPGAYKSMQVWDKVKIGLGYWFRDRHEFVLIGTRGNVVAPAPGTQDHSLFSEQKGEHSAKPDRVAEMIERLWPSLPKLEMFRRGPARPGWDAWGNEAAAAISDQIPEPVVTDDPHGEHSVSLDPNLPIPDHQNTSSLSSPGGMTLSADHPPSGRAGPPASPAAPPDDDLGIPAFLKRPPVDAEALR